MHLKQKIYIEDFKGKGWRKESQLKKADLLFSLCKNASVKCVGNTYRAFAIYAILSMSGSKSKSVIQQGQTRSGSFPGRKHR